MAVIRERPVRLIARDGRRSVVGLVQLLARRTTLGYTICYAPHGPVWERDRAQGEEVLRLLLLAAREAAQARRGIVVKVDPRAVPQDGTDDGGSVAAALERAGLLRARLDLQARTTRIVDLLDGGAALEASWKAAARNEVRRAVREGVRVDVGRAADRAAIAAFHRLLVVTAERAGFRVRPIAFLERLAASLAAGRGWYLALASLGSTPIAGMVAVRTGGRAFYLYGASLRGAAYRHAFGSCAAMAATMRVLASDGVRSLDLWGVAEPDDPRADRSWVGFSHFKRLFGGRPLRHPGTFDLVIDALPCALRDLRERLLMPRSGHSFPY